MKEPEIKLIKKEETIQLHFHPKSTLESFKDFVKSCQEDPTMDKNSVFVLEDMVKLGEYACSHIAPKKGKSS